MDPHTQRAEAERWLGIAAKLLAARDFLGSRTFAIRARETDQNNVVSDQILAIVDTVLAGEKRVNSNQQPDWYSILQLPHLIRDADLIADHYRRLLMCLTPERNRFPYADYALQLVMDAWSVLSDPTKKWLFDNELALYLQQQGAGGGVVSPQQQSSAAVGGGGGGGGQLNTLHFFQPQQQQQPQPQPQPQSHPQQQQQQQPQQQMWQQHHQQQINFMQLQEQQQQQPAQQQVPPQWQMRVSTPSEGGGGVSSGGGAASGGGGGVASGGGAAAGGGAGGTAVGGGGAAVGGGAAAVGGGAGGGGGTAVSGGGGAAVGGDRNKGILNGIGGVNRGVIGTGTAAPVTATVQQTPVVTVQDTFPVMGGVAPAVRNVEGTDNGSGTTVASANNIDSFNTINNDRVSDDIDGYDGGGDVNDVPGGTNDENNYDDDDAYNDDYDDDVEVDDDVVDDDVVDDDDDVDDDEDVKGGVDRFWTACPYCLYVYEYQKIYQGCTLRCQNCRRGFHGLQVPGPPLISEGNGDGVGKQKDEEKGVEKGKSFCTWGFFPLGFSMTLWKRQNRKGSLNGSSYWTPFTPMFACPAEAGGDRFKWFDNVGGDAFVGPKPCPKQRKEWVILDDDDNAVVNDSEPSDLDSSDGDWRTPVQNKSKSKFKKRKRRKITTSRGLKRGRPRKDKPRKDIGSKPMTRSATSGGRVFGGGEDMDNGLGAQTGGDGSAAQIIGDGSAAQVIGDASAAQVIGDGSSAQVVGNGSAAQVVGNGSAVQVVGNSSAGQEVVFGLTAGNSAGNSAGNRTGARKTVPAAVTRKVTRRSVKDVGKLDLNVKFNNEGEDHAPTVRAVNGEEEGIENIPFFEGLDEFLSTLPI